MRERIGMPQYMTPDGQAAGGQSSSEEVRSRMVFWLPGDKHPTVFTDPIALAQDSRVDYINPAALDGYFGPGAGERYMEAKRQPRNGE